MYNNDEKQLVDVEESWIVPETLLLLRREHLSLFIQPKISMAKSPVCSEDRRLHRSVKPRIQRD